MGIERRGERSRHAVLEVCSWVDSLAHKLKETRATRISRLRAKFETMAPAATLMWKGKPFKDAEHVKLLDMEVGGTAAVDIAQHETKGTLTAVADYIEDRREGKTTPPATPAAAKFLWRMYSYHPDMSPPRSVLKGMGTQGPRRTTEKKKSVFPIGQPKNVEKSLETWKRLVPEFDLPTLQLVMEHVYWHGNYSLQKELPKVKAIEKSLEHWFERIEEAWREDNNDLVDQTMEPFTPDTLFRVGIPRPKGASLESLKILWDLAPTGDAARPDSGAAQAETTRASGPKAAYRERGFSGTVLGSGSPPPVASPVGTGAPSGTTPATATPSPAQAPDGADPSAAPPAKRSRTGDMGDEFDDGSFTDAMQYMFGDEATGASSPGQTTVSGASQSDVQTPAPVQRNLFVRVVKGTVGAVGQALVNASR